MALTSFVVRVREDEEDVLKYCNEELLEELVRDLSIGLLSHIIHELNAHGETGIFNLAVVVLAGPHAGINDKFELPTV